MDDCSDNNQDDRDSVVETESNCSYEETAAKIEMVLRRNLRLDMVDNDDRRLQQPTVDVKTLPGYQAVPNNCPSWKRALIEKKNRQLEVDAMQELMAKKEERDRWRNVPEWKKQLILDKEKKKQQEMAELRHRRDKETERFKALPEWKQHLLSKRREHDAV